MNNEVVHLKLEYPEALEGRKDMLSSEINTLQLLRIIKKYHTIRNQELNKKIEMQKKIKDIQKNLELMTKLMPKPKIQKIMKNINVKTKEDKNNLNHDKDINPIEEELKEIQKRLKELE